MMFVCEPADSFYAAHIKEHETIKKTYSADSCSKIPSWS